jgi:hypothetical protein
VADVRLVIILYINLYKAHLVFRWAFFYLVSDVIY